MSQYFPKPFNSHFGDSIKVKIHLSNYATKTDIKNISHVDTSSFALKTHLSSLKTEVDKLHIDKLVPIPSFFFIILIFFSSSINLATQYKVCNTL